MAKASASKIMRLARERGLLPAGAEISRAGEATWRAHDLEYECWPERVDEDLTLALNVGDAVLGPKLSEYGRLAVRLRTEERIGWPGSSVTADQLAFVEALLGEMRAVVAGRRELALVLAAEEPVTRGRVYAWQDRGNHPARLVQALILARDLGDAGLEKHVLGILHGHPTKVPAGYDSVLTQARRWAADFGKALGQKITL